jgi:hypothetical protein
MNKLEFKCIYYREEHDTDGSLLEHEWMEEAPYRNGFLIKSVHIDSKDNRSESITFAQKKGFSEDVDNEIQKISGKDINI